MRRQNENYNRYLLSDWMPENPAFRENKGNVSPEEIHGFQ